MSSAENVWSRTKHRQSEESIFSRVISVEELLKDEKVQWSIYNEVQREDDKGKRKGKGKQEEEWSLRMACTQEWFMRCSWINKFLFIKILCNATIGCFVLQNVLKSISQIFSKDVVESLQNDSPNYAYDMIPKDDNRALDISELNNAMRDDFLWFVNLEPSYQIRVILRLLRLGGGGLIFNVYKTAAALFDRRLKIYNLLSIVPSATEIEGEWPGESAVSTIQDNEDRLNEYTEEKRNQLAKREMELQKYRKLRGISDEEGKIPKKGEVKETLDYLQILPIWLNRRIMSYIDDRGLSGFKKVGKYWGKMIDESINEKSGRKAINGKINKIIGIKFFKEDESDDEDESDELELILKPETKDFANKIKERQNDFPEPEEWYEKVFSQKFTLTPLDTTSCRGRSCSFDSVIGTLAGSNKKNMVNFYSTRTGARLNFSVFGVEFAITSLALHEDRIHIIIGCKTGHLMFKEIRTNKTKASFVAHEMAITALSVSSTNVVSASWDNTVKCFQLWSGLCFLCVNLAEEFTVSALLRRTDKPFMTVIGTREGVVIVVNITEKKFVKKAKLHADEITQLANEGDVLVTGSSGGKIRVWSLNQMKNTFPELRPHLNVNVQNSVSSLVIHRNQIFAGCKNGTIKIISLVTGNIIKAMRVSSPMPMSGLKISQDKVFMKLIIWHEGGIEIRTFSLPNSSPMKNPMRKDNRESKQKAPKESGENKTSPRSWTSSVRNIQEVIEVTPKAFNKKTLQMPLKERGCTLSTLRTLSKGSRKFTTDVFAQALNNNPIILEGDFTLKTFPRYKTV